MTIVTPAIGSAKPVPLVATTRISTGYNLAIAIGSYGNDFRSNSNSYAWITESYSDSNNEYFTSVSDYPDGAEPNVWVLSPRDSQGRIPVSLSFVGPSLSTVTCARVFNDFYYNLLGITCAAVGVYSEFDNTVVSSSSLLLILLVLLLNANLFHLSPLLQLLFLTPV